MPDIESRISAETVPAAPPPIVHPMDPRRGENLSPRFAAVLAWALQLPPVTTPAIAGIVVTGNIVVAATDEKPFHDTPIGDWHDVARNMRDWGGVCGADTATIDGLLARLRRAGP